MSLLLDQTVWASFITLAVLEIVLGVDNVVFIALLAGRLPANQRRAARRTGLVLALGTRLALLASIAWVVHLTNPVVSVGSLSFSWRDLVLLGGGAFLLYKGTREIHLRMEWDEAAGTSRAGANFLGTLVQIMIFDVVFSVDSVITAVGVAEHLWVMVAAIVSAMAVMLIASDALAGYIERHESVRMLVLSYLLLIGMMLVADGFGVHMPRGYVYAAMSFSALVEGINQLSARRRRNKTSAKRSHLLSAEKSG